jgi:hypothetical protein
MLLPIACAIALVVPGEAGNAAQPQPIGSYQVAFKGNAPGTAHSGGGGGPRASGGGFGGAKSFGGPKSFSGPKSFTAPRSFSRPSSGSIGRHKAFSFQGTVRHPRAKVFGKLPRPGGVAIGGTTHRRSAHQHRHHRGLRMSWGGPVFWFYDGYYYGDCAWLRRKAIATGSRYWWRRYRLCREGYDD